MPEILEVEDTRRGVAAHALDRPIAGVDAPDAWYLKRGLTPAAIAAVLPGRHFEAARRHGKLLLLDTSPVPGSVDEGPVLGLHLGMTGRILVDGDPTGDPLRYASNRDNPAWYRFSVRFADGGALVMLDPRRLGAVLLDPDEARLGVDAFDVTTETVRNRIGRRHTPVKAALLQQRDIAGLGNLLVDEILWRAGLDPHRDASSLTPPEHRRLASAVRTTLQRLGRRGGSHTGDLMDSREPGGRCPKD
ncbi:MAG TPA: DNA-formamidopyrimidine glycosylase family protein, partial [Acidimicrobiia bacterium]|nr:DNA-formamidopyrimidine glycosylase family protein [Acidimicrobiia bacterium]